MAWGVCCGVAVLVLPVRLVLLVSDILRKLRLNSVAGLRIRFSREATPPFKNAAYTHGCGSQWIPKMEPWLVETWTKTRRFNFDPYTHGRRDDS